MDVNWLILQTKGEYMYEYRISNVSKVVDGDTVDLTLDVGFCMFTIQRIRISGVDTPEMTAKDEVERKMANEAKAFVENWLSSNKNLTIKTTKDDKYGRMLGEIRNDAGVCLNTLLVEKGYAWSYDGGTKNKDIKLLQEKRKANG
jgi:micrococcal nuclease